MERKRNPALIYLIYVFLWMIPVITLNGLYEQIGLKHPDSIFSGSFNLIRVEDLPNNTKYPGYTRREFFKISLVRGKSRIEYPDVKFKINERALVFTNPMLPYKWEKETPDQHGYVSLFTSGFLKRFGSVTDFVSFKDIQYSVIELTEHQYTLFEDIFIRIKDELEESYLQKYELIACMMMEIIHHSNKITGYADQSAAALSPSERIVSIFLDHLERDFLSAQSSQRIRHASPSEYAQRIGVHVNHLNKVLKQLTGFSTSVLIAQRILQEASYLLGNTPKSIKEISWILGFEESNHFSSFFKKYSKQSPTEFRKPNDD
ncbi:helix-turn-helix domain-containing protein [Pedobacter miscanthi]|nr:helix-turn-helix domain-containing protein [Pedobacter miscanthi]